MTPEYEFLAHAISPLAETRPVVPAGLDWNELLRLADWHRLSSLLFRLVQRWPDLEVPSEIVGRWHDSYMATAAVNLHLRRELDRVATSFAGAGIPVMVLKGMALVEEVYGELGLRPMVDLDLLVPRADFERAGMVLAELGYVGHKGFEPRAEGASRGAFVRGDNAVGVDLHRHVADDLPLLDPADFWQRSHASRRGDYRLPQRHDLLLHLAIHFMQHRNNSSRDALGQLADMLWLIAGDIDWMAFAGLVIATGSQGRVYLVLSALRRVFEAPVPAEVLTALQPRSATDPMVDRFVLHRILETRRWHNSRYFQRRSREEFSSSARHLGRILPSRAHLFWFYGRHGEVEVSYGRLYGRRLRRMAAPLFWPHVIADEHLHRWIESLDPPAPTA